VYAEGARASEMPLEIPTSALENSVSVPNVRKPRRRMFRLMHSRYLAEGYAPICLDTNDPHTVKCGFVKRVLRDVPAPNPQLLAELRLFVKDWVSKNVRKVVVPSFEDWLERTSYSEGRKNELREAFEMNRGCRPSKRVCSKVDAFVKTEFYTEYKHCRLINSRCDRAKVWIGPRIKAVEDEIFKLPQFIKHVPVLERPEVILRLKQAGRIYYASDYTAFESHFSAEIMDAVECELYRWCLSDDVDVEFLCNIFTGINRMSTRTGVTATCKAKRMSGEMNTSLGNGFTNFMLSLFLSSRKGGEMDGVFEGDDGLFFSTVALKEEDYEQLGFTIKLQQVPDPCKASFCGMIFSDSGQIIKDPRKFLQGFGWTASALEGRSGTLLSLLRAKALSTLYEVPHCPIVGVIARDALRFTKDYPAKFISDGYHPCIPNFVPEVFNPSASTRELFHEMYGITVQEQLIAEKLIREGKIYEISSVLPPTDHCAHYFARYVC
jgi:hypothetical protein